MVLGSKAGPGIVDAMYQNDITDNAAKLIYDALQRLGLAGGPGLNASLFGSGSDGDFVVVGTEVVTEDKFYNNLTVPLGAILDVSAGVRIFVKGTLTSSGTIRSLGVDGSSGVIDAGGAGGGIAEAGASGVLGAGASAVPGFPGYVPSVGGNGGGSGTGGTGAGGAGGANLSDIVSDGQGSFNGPLASVVVVEGHAQNGQGGSSGGGDGATFNGGGGGGAGSGSAGIVLFANRLVSTNATLITIGGNGGNGGVPGGGNTGGGSGGGGGGTGGILIVVGSQTTVGGTLTRTPGTGGAGGTASGTGTPGGAGIAGGLGSFTAYKLDTGDSFVF